MAGLPANQAQLTRDGLVPQPRAIYGLPQDTASYASIQENRFREVADHPLSTFSVDVDTASYANVRRFLNEGRLPPADAVRIEELINYFKFDYPAPRNGAPVSVTTELGPAPWNPRHKLALVGLRAVPIKQEKVAPRNLTFLLDVSGSMAPENRLPLVKKAMQMLVETLREEDRVGIVVYAGNSGVALTPTHGDRKDVIKRAIHELNAGGSTNGAAGIQLAYNMATDNFIKGGINRVILATDGDFNVGVTSQTELVRLIEEKRERGIFLSVLGVGDNNLKDSTMEKLADKGNGNYNYLDSLQEARRVLIAEAGATLVTVAKDVKVQIEFNPRFVSAYRLIGYENRLLRKEDFNNDRKDAGEMGAGHTVTALYELIPPGENIPSTVDPLKYQPQPKPVAAVSASSTELMTVKVRYKEPLGDTSKLLEFPVRDTEARMTANLGFAAAVAGYGMLLRQSEFKGSTTWKQVVSLAREHRGRDEDGYRAEFIRLADLAAALSPTPPTDETARR
jgi:Ca-activated chloride channel family protein